MTSPEEPVAVKPLISDSVASCAAANRRRYREAGDAKAPALCSYMAFRALPEAEVHFYDTGHFALETHVHPIAAAIRDFLGRHV